MRLREIFREAGRNVASGTAAAVPLLLLGTLSAGACAAVEVANVAQLAAKTDAYVAGGGSTWLLDAPGRIDPDACDGLITTGNVAAAGAARRTDPLTVGALPNGPVPVFEATSGWWRLMALPEAGDLVASDQVADVIAPTWTPHSTGIDGHPLAARYAWPDDGRRSDLSYALVARAQAGRYDTCWVRMTDPTREPGPLLAVTADPAAGASQQPQQAQLNPRLGVLTAPDDFDRRPTQWSWIAGAILGALLGAGSVRVRAVEHAHLARLGQSITDHAVGVLVETLIWTTVMMALVIGGVGVLTTVLAPAHVLEIWPLGLAAPLALTAGALNAAPLTLIGVRRHGIDHYLRARAG